MEKEKKIAISAETSASSAKEDEIIYKAAKEILEKYKKAFKELAK